LVAAVAALAVCGCSRVRDLHLASARTLRVCADPNNLPFSNREHEGFENRLADLVAGELKSTVAYTWWAQRRGYFRNTIGANQCDIWMGVPTGFDRMLVTRPYYRSSYVFVTRRDGPRVTTLDDPMLRRVRIGVQLVGDDGQNTPPAHALAARHIVRNVVGFTLYGDYLSPNPPARIVEAVAKHAVDVAVVWGPFAGFFANSHALDLTPVTPGLDDSLPFAFDISIGIARRLAARRDPARAGAPKARYRSPSRQLSRAENVAMAGARGETNRGAWATRAAGQSPAAAAIAIAIIALAAGCRRESRQFREAPPASYAPSVTVSDLHPGGGEPPEPARTPFELNAQALSEGKRLFAAYNCTGCHANGGGGIGPALMDNEWLYGHEADQIYRSILEGRPNGMPSFRGKIPDFQIWELAAYIRSLGGLAPKDAAPSRSDHMSGPPPENATTRQQPRNTRTP
jgi:mxaJ protein